MKLFFSIVVLLIIIFFIVCPGCVSQSSVQPGPVSPSGTGSLAPVTPPATLPVATLQNGIATLPIAESGGTVILHDKDELTIEEYKEYKFSDMGYEFLYEGDTLKVYITSEKPVLVYCINYMDVIRLESPANTPHYETYSDKVQWGSLEPAFSLEKVTHEKATFIIRDVGRYSFIIDPRWMASDSAWLTRNPFAYEITLIKV